MIAQAVDHVLAPVDDDIDAVNEVTDAGNYEADGDQRYKQRNARITPQKADFAIDRDDYRHNTRNAD